MYRCTYCGNEYTPKPDQCLGCGSRRFKKVTRVPEPDEELLIRLGDREVYFAALDAVSMVARSAILTPLFLGLALLAVLLMTDLLFGLGV